MQPWLADGWTEDQDGQVITIALKSNVKFQDGSPFDSTAAASLLPDILRSFMGPAYSDVVSIKPSGVSKLEIRFKHPSPFLLEALEATIRKPGPNMIGTGPFMVEANSPTDLRANPAYYLGPPSIDRIVVSNHSSVRAAWAEMLRDRLDMLYEVGADGLDSMKNSNAISVFTYTRHYQHVIVFNTQAEALRSSEVRRALNLAIDRKKLVREALRDYGVPSTGPVSPQHWAVARDVSDFNFDARRAADLLASRRPATPVRFTCLVSPDSVDERIALEVKRQLAAVGVEMQVEESSRDQIVQRAGNRQYEAAIAEAISGPTILRPYMVWYSKGPINWGHFGSPTIDAAFDHVRDAPNERAYRDAVGGLQKAFSDDPPAIFLAWSVRARAVSKRFDVQVEEGRDVLSTVRFWRPSTARQQKSRN